MQAFDENEIIARLCDEATRRKAFEQVVEKYSRKLYWQIRHIVVVHEDADDVLQNTFVKAWNGLDSFRGASKLSTWLYRIAYNESLTLLSRRRETLSLSADADDEEGREAAFLQLESDPYFDGDETQRMLENAISMLPEKQRAVFKMKYYDEMKYEEMSEVTGTSVGALKASYHLAVEKITKFFKIYE